MSNGTTPHNPAEGRVIKAKDAKSSFGRRGWLFIIAMMCCCFIAGTAGTDGLNTIVTQFVDTYGWSRATLTTASSIGGFVGAGVCVVLGLIINKIGAQKVLLIVIAVLTAAVFAWGFVTTPAAYTVVVLLINGFTYGVVLCFGILAANWFPTKKGLAIGWITMGYNVATVSANWILTFGWKHFGFHGGFNIVAICGVLTFIFVLLAARENPEDVGANPDNDPDMTMEQALKLRRQGEEYMKTSPWTVRKLLTCKEVWLCGVIFGIVQMMTVGCISQLVPTVTSRGYSQELALACMTLAGCLGFFGSYITGWIDTKFGTKKATFFMLLWEIATVVVFVIPLGNWTVFLAAVMLGTILGGSNNLCTSMVSQIFGRYDQRKANTVVVPIYTFVRSIGYGLVGILAERTGGYNIPWLVLAGLSFVAIFLTAALKTECIGRAHNVNNA